MRLPRLVRFLASAVVLAACVRPAADASGAEMYAQLCARCHGAELEGGVGQALGAGSALADLTDDYLEDVTANGRGRMPAFGTTLSETQIMRLVEYIREEQGR